MASFNPISLERATKHANAQRLQDIEISHWDLWQNDVVYPYFARLRNEDPVHYAAASRYGPYWSITRFDDIKAVDRNHQVFSSASGISIVDTPPDFQTTSFIAMDQPEHDTQRKTVTPVVAPMNLARLESVIRARAGSILDGLPRGETFNWVERVSIELTTQMLATLFDFPFEQRKKLTFWSDVGTGGRQSGLVDTAEEARAAMLECLETFTGLWREREHGEVGTDLISMLIHNPETSDMVNRPMEYLGNLLLLIVGGNDTTRNSISGGVYALNRFPEQYEALRADHSLIPNMVAEIIRWQTPLSHMRRTALSDYELGGKTIRRGDKVVMWYVSGNRDERAFEDADRLIIDRPNARQHVSFGYGIHRCMGNRLAEMQLRVLWEEILARFHTIEVVGEPKRARSNFVRGYTELPVRVHLAH
jgi:cytochrome P450